MSYLDPEILNTNRLGSGRRLNVIREFIALGLTPSMIRDESINAWLPFSLETLNSLTDVQNLRESIIHVYYHPAMMAKVLGRSDSYWGSQAQALLDQGFPQEYSVKVTPDEAVHTYLQSQGVVSGRIRKPVRVIDFNLVAYLIATKVDWGSALEVSTITYLNRYKKVLQTVGGLNAQLIPIPPMDEDSFNEVLQAVSQSNPVTEPKSSVTVIHRADRAFADVEAVDVRNVEDPEALIRRLQEEVVRRKSKATMDRWIDAKVIDVTMQGDVVSAVTLRLNDGTEVEFATRTNPTLGRIPPFIPGVSVTN